VLDVKPSRRNGSYTDCRPWNPGFDFREILSADQDYIIEIEIKCNRLYQTKLIQATLFAWDLLCRVRRVLRVRRLWFPTPNCFETWLIPSRTTRSTQCYESAMVWRNLSLCHPFKCLFPLCHALFVWKTRQSTRICGSGTSCVRPWSTRHIVWTGLFRRGWAKFRGNQRSGTINSALLTPGYLLALLRYFGPLHKLLCRSRHENENDLFFVTVPCLHGKNFPCLHGTPWKFLVKNSPFFKSDTGTDLSYETACRLLAATVGFRGNLTQQTRTNAQWWVLIAATVARYFVVRVRTTSGGVLTARQDSGKWGVPIKCNALQYRGICTDIIPGCNRSLRKDTRLHTPYTHTHR